jgi:hypothetical protein
VPPSSATDCGAKNKSQAPYLIRSVRVARQMRDAYGLKPKDRPAMYVKCKVPEFERNVAQVSAPQAQRFSAVG